MVLGGQTFNLGPEKVQVINSVISEVEVSISEPNIDVSASIVAPNISVSAVIVCDD